MAFEDPIWGGGKVVHIRGQRELPGFERDALLPLQWFNDIAPSLDVLDFVQGLLIEASAAVVYGESNSGKTFWVTDLALHVAAGIEWNGRRVEQGGVVYCALEGGAGLQNRIHAWKIDHDALTSPVHFAAMRSSINLLDPDAHTDALIATINAGAQLIQTPVKLVVIDTLARAMAGGNENASEDMGALVLNMDRIRAETGACVLFVHHSGKDQAKGARGHSSLRAAIDTEVEVVAADDTGPRTATVVKQRELKKGDVHTFTLEVVELGHNRHGEPVTSCLVRYSDDKAYAGASLSRRRLPQQQQRALEVLADLVGGSGQSGHPATPVGIPSVPEKWWRERFYDRAMPGAEPHAKQKAFRRASDALINAHVVGMSAGRVWVVSKKKDVADAGQ
jgi:RecA-family ATPase